MLCLRLRMIQLENIYHLLIQERIDTDSQSYYYRITTALVFVTSKDTPSTGYP